ncbi:fungal hydrophobin-domain-containing protein [Crucibulum laeve]|uniref:Hydrophobin n=1 Tax=Crucibulum laeve TaxID=68775 RepID=A0A5C3MEM2_9AGAR|nr:fungal hydrophobin-domain-containing protein [Crucibulum laeve]
MFSRAFAACVLALPLLSAAIPAVEKRGGGKGGSYTCNSGSLNCCNQVQQANPAATSFLNGLLGIVIPVGIPIGLNCDPISALIGVGTNSCNQQTVCCNGNTVGGGLITLDCTPANVVV